MRSSSFNRLLKRLGALTPAQGSTVKQVLSAIPGGVEEGEMPFTPNEPPKCLSCVGSKAIRWGVRRGVQRYRCNTCRCTFTPLSHTPLKGLHLPERWLSYQQSLLAGRTLSETSEECGIHPNTAHRWRKRFLEALEMNTAPEKLAGIVEADETFVRRSCKGRHRERLLLGRHPRKRGGKAHQRGRSREQVFVLAARDRGGNTSASVSLKANTSALISAFSSSLIEDSVLVSDGFPAYGPLARDRKLQHEKLNASAKEFRRGVFHLQNINAYHGRLKRFLTRFAGVSTRYLFLYLRWFRVIEQAITPRALLDRALGAAI